MFIEFKIIDKKNSKPISHLLDEIDKKIMKISSLESNNIRLATESKVNYELYEDLTFYRDVLIEKACDSGCIPYPMDKIISRIHHLLNQSC